METIYVLYDFQRWILSVPLFFFWIVIYVEQDFRVVNGASRSMEGSSTLLSLFVPHICFVARDRHLY